MKVVALTLALMTIYLATSVSTEVIQVIIINQLMIEMPFMIESLEKHILVVSIPQACQISFQ